MDSDPSGRRGLPITTIKQGAEPPTFTGWFQAWDPKMWETDPLDRIRGRFWTHKSKLLFLPIRLLTCPTPPTAILFILTPIPKCQNQCYHCYQVEWLPLCLCPVQSIGLHKQERITSVVKWLPVATSLIDRSGLLICCLQQLVAFMSLSKLLIWTGNRKGSHSRQLDTSSVTLCSLSLQKTPSCFPFCLSSQFPS